MLEKKRFIFILDSWLELKGTDWNELLSNKAKAMDEGSEDGQIAFENSINKSLQSNSNGKAKV